MTLNEPFPARRIEIAALACRRGERLLFENLSFTLGAGELLQLRGPNGAGKSTLLFALAGLFRPESGAIRLGEVDEESPLHLVGHLPAVRARLTVTETLSFWTAVNGGDRTAIRPALETVGLGRLGALDAGWLSAGQTRRLALARLLTASRPIWLLDEPTSALDAEGEALVETLIAAHLGKGGLAIAATHHDLGAGPHAVRTLAVGR